MAYLGVRGVDLHFSAAGAGAPVVALHGSTGSGAQWRSLTEYLAGRFRVIAPDLPGHGGSQPAPGPATGLAGDAGQILGLIAEIGAPVHLVGHGYGGAVALKIARRWPELLRSMTLIEPAALHVLREGTRGDAALHEWMRALTRRIATETRAGRRAAAMAAYIDCWNGRGAWARTSAGLRAALAGGLDTVLANLAALDRETDALRDYARVETPTLAVFGLESPPVAMRLTELIAETLPRAELRMVPDAGHQAPLTDPHILDPMIWAHLMRAGDAPARASRHGTRPGGLRAQGGRPGRLPPREPVGASSGRQKRLERRDGVGLGGGLVPA